jgi:cytochrome P450
MRESVAFRPPVVDFDFYADRRFDEAGGDLHLALSRLNAEAPGIFWSPSQGGYWIIRSRDLVYEAAHATDLFSSRAMNIPADDREFEMEPAIPIMLDPPEHGAYRQPLAALFGPRRMARLERGIRDHAIALIEVVRGQGGCDFVKAVCEPLPVLTFMDLIGFDRTRLGEFRELAITGSVDPDPVVKREASLRVCELMADFVDRRYAERRAERRDLTDELMALDIGGRPITPAEVKGYCRLLFFAGLDTVVNAMAFGIRYLAKHPAAQERMRARPADIKPAVEELLRLGGPATLGRCVTRDAVWHGVALRKRDRVLLELPAANLDPEEFVDPLAFDPGRANLTHLTFNSGPHRCLGQHLARIELRVMYEEWLARIPPFSLDPRAPARVHGGMVMGVDSLPLLW